jgi:hypothetical protein
MVTKILNTEHRTSSGNDRGGATATDRKVAYVNNKPYDIRDGETILSF